MKKWHLAVVAYICLVVGGMVGSTLFPVRVVAPVPSPSPTPTPSPSPPSVECAEAIAQDALEWYEAGGGKAKGGIASYRFTIPRECF